jgi:hypothetical protein
LFAISHHFAPELNFVFNRHFFEYFIALHYFRCIEAPAVQ